MDAWRSAGTTRHAAPVRELPGATLWGVGILLFAAGMGPAVLNGAPLVFPNTALYFQAAEMFRPNYERAFGYAAFLRISGALLSLWLPVCVQAALAAGLVTRALALEAGQWPRHWRGPAVAVLGLVLALGPLPWLASWLMPDVFTGLMVLTLWILARHWPGLGGWERGGLLLLLLGAAATHLTHPPLLLGLGLFAGMVAWMAARCRAAESPPGGIRRIAAIALVTAALAQGALIGANWVTYRIATASVSGPAFLFARLAADGDARAALRPGCEAGAGWKLCQHLDSLSLPPDEFLWGDHSPLPELGYMQGFWPEAAQLNPILLRHHWRGWLAASAGRLAEQLGRFGLGDGMDAQGLAIVQRDLRGFGLPEPAAQLQDTRQQAGRLRALMPRGLADVLAGVALLALPGLCALGLARRRVELWWPALLVLACWLGNAALVALGSSVHDRYGARLVWIMPLVAGFLALQAAHWRAMRPVASPALPRQAGDEAGRRAKRPGQRRAV